MIYEGHTALLQALTEGRLPGINHEIVPDYLRTKPQPEVEDKVMFLLDTNATHSG